jgi:hypothetical protein
VAFLFAIVPVANIYFILFSFIPIIVYLSDWEFSSVKHSRTVPYSLRIHAINEIPFLQRILPIEIVCESAQRCDFIRVSRADFPALTYGEVIEDNHEFLVPAKIDPDFLI